MELLRRLRRGEAERKGVRESEQERDQVRKFSVVYLPGRNSLAPKVHIEPTKHYVGRLSLSSPSTQSWS